MSDGRQRLSGHAYKKRALEKNNKEKEALNKTPKLHNYFTKKHGTEEKAGPEKDCLVLENKDDNDVTVKFLSNISLFQPDGMGSLPTTNNDVDVLSTTSCLLASTKGKEEIKNLATSDETTDIKSNEKIINDDPGTWIISDFIRDYVAENGCSQNKNLDFSITERVYSDAKARKLTETLFERKLLNGEKVQRPWLSYSASKKSVYCVPCLLFDADCSFNGKAGFNDWRHGGVRVAEHGNSKNHIKNMTILKERSSIKKRIDNDLMIQFDNEITYWKNVLKRVVAATKALAPRGLPFRGSNEKFGSPNNGNFLMLIELLALFDPFLEEHIRRYGNKGSGSTSYLSKTIYEEFIQLLADEVLSIIVEEVKTAKYFGVIVDSTPDISHVDQLTFVLRYVQKDGTPVERFLMFIDNTGHKAEDLLIAVTSALEFLDLDIADCRSQSYDNANNVSGIYSGLQAGVKEINDLAEHAPCAAHSLNLVGVHAIESCTEAASFFNTVQALYNFFTASTNRWAILQAQCVKKIVLKSLSATRWSARQDAVKILYEHYGKIIETLILFEEDVTENAITRQEARGLRIQLERLEITFMHILWHFLLSRFHTVSKRLQKVEINITDVINDYRGLIKVVADTRMQFEVYEKEALNISESQEYQATVSRKRRRKLQADESRDGEVQLTGSDNFRVNTFNIILDNVDSELRKRSQAYEKIYEKFSVITDFGGLNFKELRERSEYLRKAYTSDLEISFTDEMIHFHAYCSERKIERNSPSDLLKLLRTNELYTEFPNVEIAYRIFNTLASTNCSAERSFSCLDRVKNHLRSTMSENRLNSLALLCIESDLLERLNCDNLIHQFAVRKVRRVRI